MTTSRRAEAAWTTVMMDNKNKHREKEVMKSKLEEMKKELKEAQVKRKSMVEKMKEMVKNEMATTNPKSNKKSKVLEAKLGMVEGNKDIREFFGNSIALH